MAFTTSRSRAGRRMRTVARVIAAALLAPAAVLPAQAAAAGAAVADARVVTVVRDARTGAPVAGVTLHAVAAGDRFADLWGARALSDDRGLAVFDALVPGRYSFFAQPGDTGHGMQWVGARGGTGDRDTALTVSTPARGVRRLPDVRLDPAGAVTGTLTEARTGAPVNAQVSVASMDPLWQDTTPYVFGAGSFTFAGLGPYRWTLFFMPDGSAGPAGTVAAHWSGGAADRRLARGIPVTAGRTTVADQRFRAGTTVSGDIAGGAFGPVYALHATTHEIMAVSDDPSGVRYAVRLLPGQRVKLCEARTRCYPGGVGVDDATPIAVGFRPLVVDLPGA